MESTQNSNLISPNDAKMIATTDATKLGRKLENPYSVKSMTTAFNNLTNENCQLPITHLYVRFLPKNVEQYMQLLDDTTLQLSDTPFDYEIISLGNHYQDPNIAPEKVTWQYAAVPISKILPTNIETELLDDLYLPASNTINHCKATLDVEDLEREAFAITNNADLYDMPQSNPQKGGVKIQQRFNPEGDITVQNVQLGNVPLRNTKIVSRSWFMTWITHTDANGHFRIGYRYNSRVIVKVKFQNRSTDIRSLKDFDDWRTAGCVQATIGMFSGNAMTNINFNVANAPNNRDGFLSEQKREWAAAHAINALEEYRDMAQAAGIALPPRNINVYLSNSPIPQQFQRVASAPMFKQMAKTGIISNAILLPMTNIVTTTGRAIVRHFLPDIYVNFFGVTQSDRFTQTFYHELAHTSHYTQVGNFFWTAYVGYIVLNGGYGDQNSTGVGRIELSEGWANYAAHVFTNQRYGAVTSLGLTNWQQIIERFGNRANNFPFNTLTGEMVAGGAMYDLTDGGQEPIDTGIDDQVNTYTMAQIFEAMQSNTTTVPDFRNLLLQQNNNRQQLQTLNLFASYGW